MNAPLTVSTDTATERVRDRMRSEILDGVFKPGERLKIVEIAARYGISPIPVREAMRLLAGEGLIEMIAHRGAVVRQVDRDFIIDMYDIRAALEGMLAERAIARMRAATLKVIRAAAADYAKAAAKLKLRAMFDANAAFHGEINAAGNNPEAVRMVDGSSAMIRAMRARTGMSAERAAINVAQHAAIVAALEAKDAGGAAAAVRIHCITGRDDLLVYFDAENGIPATAKTA